MTGLVQEVAQGAWPIWRRLLPVWAALTGLLVLTLSLAYVPMGRFNVVVALTLAFAKALLIVLFFMKLREPDPLLRLAGAAAMIWLFFMFSLTTADYLTRLPYTQPGTVVVHTYERGKGQTGQRAFH